MKFRLEILFILVFCFLFLYGSKKNKNKNKNVSIEINKEIKPNVLIIFPDQLRRYSAGYWSKEPYKNLVYGKPDPVITPNIDNLAENGIVFTNAVSNYPVCSPFR